MVDDQASAGPRPLRVGYLVPPSIHFAGIERVTHEIATGLAATHPLLLDVHVAYASRYDESLLNDTAYTSHFLDVHQLRELPGALRRVVADHEFDVLVTPQVEASVIAWSATRGLRLRALLPHLHGNPRTERAEGTRRTRAAFAFFERVVATQVPMVLAVAPSLRDYAATSIVKRSKVVYVPNPVRDIGSGDRVPPPDGRMRLVSVGRLSRQKGQDLLLRALALARESLPPTSLTLVGSGPEEHSLRALCTELGLDDVVTFAGYSSDPVQHLNNADLFVLASRWEGFGVAIVEALQCGLPVVATNCEFGPADVLTSAALGVLVRPDDPAALAAGLIEASSRDWSGGEKERRTAAAAFDRPAAVAAHFSVLTSLGL